MLTQPPNNHSPPAHSDHKGEKHRDHNNKINKWIKITQVPICFSSSNSTLTTGMLNLQLTKCKKQLCSISLINRTEASRLKWDRIRLGLMENPIRSGSSHSIKPQIDSCFWAVVWYNLGQQEQYVFVLFCFVFYVGANVQSVKMTKSRQTKVHIT